MRAFWVLLLIAIALSGPYRYLTVGAAARDARYAHLEEVREAAVGVRELLGENAPPPRHLLETRRASLDGLDERVAAFGRSLSRDSSPPDVDALRAAGRSAGVRDPILAPLLASIDRGVHAPHRRAALATVLRALEGAGRPTVESLDVAAAPSTRAGAPPLTMFVVGLTVLGPPTALVSLTEDLVIGSDLDPPGDLVEAVLTKTHAAEWERLGVGPEAPPARLKLQVELLMGGG